MSNIYEEDYVRFPFRELKRRCDSTQRYQEGNTSSAALDGRGLTPAGHLRRHFEQTNCIMTQDLFVSIVFALSDP